MYGTVVDDLEKRIVLLWYRHVKNADESVVTASEQVIRLGWVEIESCEIVVVFRVLPFWLVLSVIPVGVRRVVS